MTILKLFIFIISIILLVTLYKNNKALSIVFVAILLGLNIFYIIQNGVEWMYYPIYIFISIAVLLIFFNKPPKMLMTTILFIFFLVSFISVLMFPVYEVPKPTGEYLIGTKEYILRDENRVEQYDNSKNNRKFKIQVWYPADSVENFEQAYWLSDGINVAKGLSKDSGLFSFMFNQLLSIRSNSYIDAKLSRKENTYPLIIISHGWRGLRNLHQDFAEELASQGYIVVGIEHTYGSVATVFKEKTVYVNHAALLVNKSKEEYLGKANKLVNTYAADISKTIDFMEILNLNDKVFLGKIDKKKIGLLGHSTGGGADVRATLTDKRIKAVIGLDAWVEPIKEEYIARGLNVPSLFFRSEQWEKFENNKNLKKLIEKSAHKPLLYQIAGTTHLDFSMIYMLSPALKLLGFSGEINNKNLRTILTKTIDSFFNQVLKNEEKVLIDIKNYKDVEKIKIS